MGRLRLSIKVHARSLIKTLKPLYRRLRQTPTVVTPRVFETVSRWGRAQQRQFDESFPLLSDGSSPKQTACATSVIISSCGPFAHVTNLVQSIALSDDLFPGEIVVVDTTAERRRGAAIEEPLKKWRALLPQVRFQVVNYDKQDFNFSDAYNVGARATTGKYLLIMNDDIIVTSGWLSYLIRAFNIHGGVVFPLVLFADGRIQFFGNRSVPHLKDETYVQRLRSATDYQALDTSAPPRAFEHLGALPVLEEGSLINGSIFFGNREELLDPQTGLLFDPVFVNETQDDDIAIRVAKKGLSIHAVSASVVFHLSQATRGFPPLWELIHDHIWLNQKWGTGRPRADNRIELICPFHRGDVLLAIQVAQSAAKAGMDIRLHVAEGLLSWVRDFDATFEVAGIPVSVPNAEETASVLERAYQYVVQRADVSSRVVRLHPKRGLGATDRHLLSHVFEQMGVPLSNQLENFAPRVSAEQREWAKRLVCPQGEKVLLLHRSGGWGLKTIPEPLLSGLIDICHGSGYRVVQIGGKADPKVTNCDDWILENHTPSQWRAIFEASSVVVGVDSWSAHFASILNVPQVTFYGSTNPKHVHSKSYFKRGEAPSFILGPTVPCSPCDSLICMKYPKPRFLGRTICGGYTLGQEGQLLAFLNKL
jgi:GT2 family glycosyltransferase